MEKSRKYVYFTKILCLATVGVTSHSVAIQPTPTATSPARAFGYKIEVFNEAMENQKPVYNMLWHSKL